jgi:hypothetical protein
LHTQDVKLVKAINTRESDVTKFENYLRYFAKSLFMAGTNAKKLGMILSFPCSIAHAVICVTTCYVCEAAKYQQYAETGKNGKRTLTDEEVMHYKTKSAEWISYLKEYFFEGAPIATVCCACVVFFVSCHVLFRTYISRMCCAALWCGFVDQIFVQCLRCF